MRSRTGLRGERAATLIELLIFLGLVAIFITIVVTSLGGGPSGGSVPGADPYIQNVTNAENVISQFSGRTMNSQACEILKSYYNSAEQGWSNMQASGKVSSDALRAARERLDKIKAFVERNCAG